jgi:hypothetical protein
VTLVLHGDEWLASGSGPKGKGFSYFLNRFRNGAWIRPERFEDEETLASCRKSKTISRWSSLVIIIIIIIIIIITTTHKDSCLASPGFITISFDCVGC